MLTLYLLRHGKAVNADEADNDYDRPLNKKGVVQINQVGKQLENILNGDLQIISSEARRTAETAQIANFYLKTKQIAYHRSLYLASMEDILSSISELSECNQVLYVGHNFGISDLASHLLKGRVSMSTGMLLGIQFETDDWKNIEHAETNLSINFQPNVYIP